MLQFSVNRKTRRAAISTFFGGEKTILLLNFPFVRHTATLLKAGTIAAARKRNFSESLNRHQREIMFLLLKGREDDKLFHKNENYIA